MNDDNEDRDDVEAVSRADDLKLDIELKELSDVEVEESTPGFAVDEFVVEEAEVGDEDDEEDTNDEENMEDDEEEEKSFGKILFVSLVIVLTVGGILLFILVIMPTLVSILI